MRTRHSIGGVRKQRGRWIGMWYERWQEEKQSGRLRQRHDQGRSAGSSCKDRRWGTRQA